MERKYRQRGYEDRDGREKKRERGERGERHDAPRPKQELLGPRTPRMVGTVMRARCANCGAVLPPGFNPKGQCPRCHAEIHCCKQCVHFDTGKQFECTQPITERITKKDAKNDCKFFELRMTVEKDTSPVNYSANTPAAPASPARPNDARKAFEDLFKK
jgi:hypothetical protein